MKNYLTMLGMVAISFNEANAQELFSENFEANAMTEISPPWIINAGSAPNMTFVNGLSYSNYPLSSIGNALQLNSSASYSYYHPIESSKTVYSAFMIRVPTNAQSVGKSDYILSLGRMTSTGTPYLNQVSRVVVKYESNDQWRLGLTNYGLTNSDNPPSFSTQLFDLDKTYLCIMKSSLENNYEFKIWLFDDNVPVDEQDAGEPLVATSTLFQTWNSTHNFEFVQVRQSASLPTTIIDGLKVFKTWSAYVLPIRFLDFRIESIDVNRSQLIWKVSESNMHHHEIEKSIDGTHYSMVGSLAALNSTEYNVYRYSVENETNKKRMYRIKSYDNDGKFSYSKIIETGIMGASNIQCRKTAKNIWMISYLQKEIGTDILLYDVAGSLLKSWNQLYVAQYALNLTLFKTGVYFLVVNSSKGEVYKQKLFVE